MAFLKLYIIGAGVGDADFLTGKAANVLLLCDTIVTTQRLFDNFAYTKKVNADVRSMALAEIAPFLQKLEQENCAETVGVLVSGDVGFFSAAKRLRERFPTAELVSGISSLQYLTAKSGQPYDDIKVVSLHGRERSIVPFVCYNSRVFALLGGDNQARDVIAELAESGLGRVTVTVGERLSHDEERIITDSAQKLLGREFAPLCVMLIANERAKECAGTLYDEDFLRAEGVPMTKEATRALALSYLDIRAQEKVVDIGAGSGSLTVEMARKAHEEVVYAVEKSAKAIAVLRQNIEKHGAANVKIISGNAPDALVDLPVFDKAFIGGSGGNLRKIVGILLEKNPCIRIVITAVTLQTLGEAQAVLSENGFKIRVLCVNVARAQKLGEYDLMMAENPVYILAGDGKNGEL